MNIKKIISRLMACALIAATTLSVGAPKVQANAAETEKDGWKTLVLICPRAEIKQTPYTSAGTTLMYQREVDKVKEDAKALEEYVNIYSCNRANMKVDVAVSDMPIENKSLSMAYGPFIGAYNVKSILDKYAPKGKYDHVMMVYRNKDWSTNLATANITDYPSKDGEATNGAIFTTVKLDDADHSMNFMDKIVPMYLLDRFAESTSLYLRSEGFNVDIANPPTYIEGYDSYQFCKGKRNYYKYYFFNKTWDGLIEKPITEEMWNARPTSKLK